MRKAVLALAALCCGSIGAVVPVSTARADGGDFGAWTRETTDKGCYLFEFTTYYFLEDDPPGFVWIGPCTPGQPINGQGTLYIQVSDGFNSMRSLEGRVVNGLFEGPVEMTLYEVDENGVVDPSSAQPGYAPMENHQGGCPESWIGSAEGECQPGQVGGVHVLRQISPPFFQLPTQLSGMGGEPEQGPLGLRDMPGAGAPATAPAATRAPLPMAPQTASSSADGGDVFGPCVEVEGIRSGIQMIWRLRNVCSTRINVAYCFRATYEAAGDTNLCSQGRYRNDSIGPGGHVDYPFTPIEEGDALSDGRIARGNQVSMQGAACANGSSPSVYISNKTLIFQRC